MPKSIYKIIFFIYISFILVNLTQAKEINISYLPLNDISIGTGFDTYKEEIKKISIKEPSIKEIQKSENVIYKIKFIPDITSLVNEIGISDNPSSIFADSPKTKLLEDIKIDDYTLSYLIYVKVTNSVSILEEPIELNEEALQILSKKENKKQKLSKFHKTFGNYFLKKIEKGGEFISLIKIVANSKLDYKNIKEQLNYIGLKWNKRNNILKELKKLSKDHEIITKTLTISNTQILPTDNLEGIFKNAESFPQKIKEYPTFINYIFSSYDIFEEYKKIKNQKDSTREYLTKARDSYINHLTLANNLFFIMKNDKQFRFDLLKKKEQMINYKKIADKSLNDSLLIKLNFKRYKKDEIEAKDILNDITTLKKYIKDLIIPPRYKASIPNSSLKITERKLFASRKDENINTDIHKNSKTPWIDLKTDFHIEKKGKIIFLTSQIVAKKDEKTVFSRKNHEIVFDTYIDFPGLRFTDIKPTKGSLFTDTITEKSNWKEFKGKGVIKSAFCGYDIEGEDKKVNMGCVKIIFNDLKIDFAHEENFLKEPIIYEKAHKIFSFLNGKSN